MNKVFIILCVGCFLFSCKSKKSIVTKRPKSTTTKTVKKGTPQKDTETPVSSNKTYANATEKYIDVYKVIAKQEMKLYNIPASITLAQGILESGSGNGRLSVKANNHFGIKCHNWTGAKIYHDDDKKGECFRKYNNAKYSFRDHSLFLTGRKRYENLFKLKKNDYKGWAKGLKAAGYATDKKYPQKLISLIERYNLDAFDDEVLGYKKRKQIKKIESVQKDHVVSKGDTLYSISKMYNKTVDELLKLNNLNKTDIQIGQILKIK